MRAVRRSRPEVMVSVPLLGSWIMLGPSLESRPPAPPVGLVGVICPSMTRHRGKSPVTIAALSVLVRVLSTQAASAAA